MGHETKDGLATSTTIPPRQRLSTNTMKFLSISALILTASAFAIPAYHKLQGYYAGTTGTEMHADAQHSEVQSHGEPSHGEHSQGEHSEGEHHAAHKILVTSPVKKDVISTQQYVCQIHSRRHIEVRALEGGYLESIPVKEGQSVKRGDLMFKILPVLLEAKLDADLAEARLAEIELKNTQKLFQQNIESDQAVALAQARLAKAQAMVELAQAELNFTNVKAPFDGIVDRLHEQQGSLISEGDVLTTLSDNDVMWVYFNVPEARYLEYKAELDADKDEADLNIELKLANHRNFQHTGNIGAIEADFNNETGNIAFRADFPNPDGLLRHGQTGTVLINRTLKNAIVIPQRATYEILAKRYAYVVGEDGVVHQRDITIQTELDDIFVIEEGLEEGDRIVLEGIRQVRDGDKVEYEFRDPAEVLGNLKNHAE